MRTFEFGFILFFIWLCMLGIIAVLLVNQDAVLDHIDALYTPSPTAEARP